MLARVTRWEGGTADGIRAAAEEIRSNISQGPPSGMKTTGLRCSSIPKAAAADDRPVRKRGRPALERGGAQADEPTRGARQPRGD